ncbi:MAG TPA: DUF4411 family protein [Gemmatimonadales bacterium]|nr:DUF4411 family protein [Gemmatimonadales bacterium]
MPYLLDANVLIRARRDHYRLKVFPCFWDWIEAKNAAGVVYSVTAIRQELQLDADLAPWVQKRSGLFLAPDSATTSAAATVSGWVKDPARVYRASAVSTFFAAGDYWLISHALATGYTVVTHEVPEPLSQRKVKIPDVCKGVGVSWTTPFEMLQQEGASFP